MSPQQLRNGCSNPGRKLRKNHYHGLPFKVTNDFEFIAREVRELMASWA
ncbi:hypothetical protein ACNKHO_20305 [Shigella flexneri]